MFGTNNNQQNGQNSSLPPQPAGSHTASGWQGPTGNPNQSSVSTSPAGAGMAAPAPINDINPPSEDKNSSTASNQLLDIKKQALGSLTPLISHLDQTAEEQFKTLMMLIQASDNADLLGQAYEAANKIDDQKVRAQALLDVVNEINYFTNKDSNPN